MTSLALVPADARAAVEPCKVDNVTGMPAGVRLWPLVVAALWLGACSAADDAGRRYRTTGNSDKVIVWGAGDEATAQPLAQQHCEVYGKSARFARLETTAVARHTFITSVRFVCVTPDEPSTA